MNINRLIMRYNPQSPPIAGIKHERASSKDPDRSQGPPPDPSNIRLHQGMY
jgi:hypothetical protein